MQLRTVFVSLSFLAAGALASAFAFGDAQKPSPQKPPIAWEGSTISSLEVKDLAASKAWYAKVLGSSVHYELAEKGWCELSTPVANTYLGLSQEASPQSNGGACVSFGVKDMGAALAWLKQCGVELEGDVIEIPSVVKLAYFRDPDRNRLLFYAPFQAP